MTLGGYQKIDLSPADLTASTLRLDGLSKACAGANGKAVLIKMPGGTESFGAVEETESGFAISTMGADGKVATMAVDDTDDTFTYTESESGTETDGRLDALEERIGADEFKTANAVDLSGYDGSMVAEKYLATADGYVWVRVANVASNHVQVNIQSNDRANTYDVSLWGNTGGNTDVAVFVKKGFYLYTAANVGSGNTMIYVPFE